MSSLSKPDTIILHTISRVKELFLKRPDKVHGIQHAQRVAAHAEYIAKEEGADAYIAILAGWLHDIGRAIEEHPEDFPSYDSSKTHHELSYEMLRDWFREDSVYDDLTDTQKIELLYAVRYHWNDDAKEYKSAIILRDADKLDGFGEIGLQRSIDFFPNPVKRNIDLRLRYHTAYYLQTKTAKDMFAKLKLLEPINAYLQKINMAGISPIEL